MKIRTIRDIKIKKGTRVLVRADIDVAMERGRVVEPFRLEANLPTLRRVLSSGAYIRLIGHLGRPDGVPRANLSIRPVMHVLERMLRRRIIVVADPFSSELYSRYHASRDIIAFENIRFWSGEEKNDLKFAHALSKWGDCYINEAFAASHRAHASLVGLPRYLPSAAGLRLEEEISRLERLSRGVRRPFVALIGGGKSSTKLPVVRRFLRDADAVLLGGGLANTFLYFRGVEVGRSIAERNPKAPEASLAGQRKLYLPSDAVTVHSLRSRQVSRVAPVQAIRKGEYIVDVGPETVSAFRAVLKRARTVVWNGPLGFAEVPAFAGSTKAMARTIAALRAYTVIGGGDTIAILRKYKLLKGFTHISTGGGAMLEFLAGKELPAIRALKKK